MDKNNLRSESNEPSEKPEAFSPDNHGPLAKPQDDDQLLASVSNNMTDDDLPNEPEHIKPKKSKKKLIVGLILLIIIGAIAGGWYWWAQIRQSEQALPPVDETPVVESTPGYNPDTVAYAYRADDNSGYSLYWRPAEGGDREEVITLNRDANILHSAIRHSNVAFSTETSIYISTDAGKSYDELLRFSPGEQLTSLTFAADENTLVYGSLVAGQNTVTSLAVDSEEPEELFVAESEGVFIHAWNNQEQKIIYSVGCYNCGGPSRSATYSRDLSTEESTKIIEDVDPRSVQNLSVSIDLSHIVLVQATIDESINTGDLPGYYLAAPYTVKLINLENSQEQVIATIGEKEEKHPNGTQRYRTIPVGFAINSNSAYYANESQLFLAGENSAEATMIFETTDTIHYTEFIDGSTIITGFGESREKYTLLNFDRDNQESETIYVGDENTILFGITTK